LPDRTSAGFRVENFLDDEEKMGEDRPGPECSGGRNRMGIKKENPMPLIDFVISALSLLAESG
jgi:hypothetical protein